MGVAVVVAAVQDETVSRHIGFRNEHLFFERGILNSSKCKQTSGLDNANRWSENCYSFHRVQAACVTEEKRSPGRPNNFRYVLDKSPY